MVAAEGLVIDWAQMPTYNTVMSVAVGAGLILLVMLGRELLRAPGKIVVEGWSLAFGVLGTILTATGLHMTLTWPLAAGGFPFDNIVFGETSLAFGVLLLAAAFYLWTRGRARSSGPTPPSTCRPWRARLGVRARHGPRPRRHRDRGRDVPALRRAAGGADLRRVRRLPARRGDLHVRAHRARGRRRDPLPFAVRSGRRVVRVVIGWAWGLSGVAFLLFGAMNFFTHIGLIVNTMG